MLSYLMNLRQIRYLKSGHLPEFYAGFILSLKGHKIIHRRYRFFCGEIDLISLKGNAVVFTEVKYRKTKQQAVEAIEPRQVERIKRAASYFLATGDFDDSHDVRFDAFLIYEYGSFEHFANGF